MDAPVTSGGSASELARRLSCGSAGDLDERREEPYDTFKIISKKALADYRRAEERFLQFLGEADVWSNAEVSKKIIDFHLVEKCRTKFRAFVKSYGAKVKFEPVQGVPRKQEYHGTVFVNRACKQQWLTQNTSGTPATVSSPTNPGKRHSIAHYDRQLQCAAPTPITTGEHHLPYTEDGNDALSRTMLHHSLSIPTDSTFGLSSARVSSGSGVESGHHEAMRLQTQQQLLFRRVSGGTVRAPHAPAAWMEPVEHAARISSLPRSLDSGTPASDGKQGLVTSTSLFTNSPHSNAGSWERTMMAAAPHRDDSVTAKARRLSCPASHHYAASATAIDPLLRASQRTSPAPLNPAGKPPLQRPCSDAQSKAAALRQHQEQLTRQTSLKRNVSDSGVFRPLSDSAITRTDMDGLEALLRPEGDMALPSPAARRHTESGQFAPPERPVQTKNSPRPLVPSPARERSALAQNAPLQPATMMHSRMGGAPQHPEAGLRDFDDALNGFASNRCCDEDDSFEGAPRTSYTASCTPTQSGFGTDAEIQQRGDPVFASLLMHGVEDSDQHGCM